MISKKNCVAMLLAGGQGSRLGALTAKRAKPAVPYGGKYRIIDFPLSNCVHSGIDTVGVLTQYQPLELNSYIGTGAPWDLDCMNGGAFILPPYEKSGEREWYTGTANAIYQNMSFIDRYDPKIVLVLSGDHIYKMDYSAMIDFHNKHNADATIAVIKVPLDQASRFGIMNTDSENRITEFDEKPEHPKNDMASMGVYVFEWSSVRKYLVDDAHDPESANDFGKNIIPAMLSGGESMFAYPFDGYWKDVGTVESLWDANMELISTAPSLDLYDPIWRIYSRNPNKPPHYTAQGAVVRNAIVSEGCFIYGTVENSVLFPGVHVSPGAVVRDSIVMQEVIIRHDAQIIKSIIDEEVTIGRGCRIGGPEAIAVIGQGSKLREFSTVEAGAQLSPGTIL